MIFTLDTLRESTCQNVWHDMINAGKLVGASVDVPDEKAKAILSRCNEPLAAVAIERVQQPAVAIPRDQWPLKLKALALFAKPGDAGLGDTIERIIGPIGGDVFKKWYKDATGQDCGCVRRKEQLNLQYPLTLGSN